MPKTRKTSKVNGVVTVSNVATKFRIGTRKAGTSASLMSTKRLLEVLEDKTKKRYKEIALTVLRHRGVTVPA